MFLSIIGLVFSLALLIWSADHFIDGAAVAAKYIRIPPLLIGMLIVGFGTSAPEMFVSAIASMQGNPGIALGNAYGSNITNIALILGVTAMIIPITVHSKVLCKELPILIIVTLLTAVLLIDNILSRGDALILLGVFIVLVVWSVLQGIRTRSDAFGKEMAEELSPPPMSIGRALFWLILGLVLLVAASRILVWAAVRIVKGFGISDLVIGLTIVAVGTSLPEFASSIIAARKKQYDIALGNIIGSNLFNTLAVVGIAGIINPMKTEPVVLSRDILVMALATVSLLFVGYGFRGRQGRINRFEGALLFAAYIAYTAWLVLSG
jgi:cation:H+ antiporter